MKKNHFNLKRLCTKLQHRYGEHDVLVMQLKHELDSREIIEIRDRKWAIPYGAFIQASLASLVERPLSRKGTRPQFL